MRRRAVDSGPLSVDRVLKFVAMMMLAVAMLGNASTLRAQTESATVAGRVTDPQGAALVGAEVVLTNMDTNVDERTKTNAEGLYTFPGTEPGRYRVTAGSTGFKTLIKENLVLHVQDEVAENFALELGSVSESVTVNSNSLNINTTDGSVSTVIDRQFVENIPLNGRSFQDLIDLTPGVVTQSPQSGGYPGSNGDFSVNGQRTQSNNYLLDGISANTNPGSGGGAGPGSSGSVGASTVLGTTQSLLSVDALQEFRVESSTYSAEYGLTPGGQFSFVTRSGTNAFHGSLFDYLRNDVFDANDWFNDHYGVPKPALRQNDFGGTIGGPISIPGIYDGKDKSFFFFSYEGLRLTQPTEATPGEYVPSMSLRAAAPSAIQPTLNAFPLPTGPEIQIACDNVTFRCPTGQPLGTVVPSGLAPFLRAYSLPSSINSTLLRLDHEIDTRTHLFLRAAYTPNSDSSRSLSNLALNSSNEQTYGGGVDIRLSNNLNNELRMGYSRSSTKGELILDNFGGAVPVNLAQALGNVVSPTSYNFFSIYFNGVGGTNIGTQAPANYQRMWNVTDMLSEARGHHSLKVGVDYRRITAAFAVTDPDVNPEYLSVNSVLTNNADVAYLERQLAPELVYNDFALFAQDEWRVTTALNLSLGLRWEVDPAPYSVNAVKPYPLLGNTDDPSTYAVGTPGAQLYKTTWHNFAPRVGVAWRLGNSRGSETVLRAGAGVFFDTGTSGTYNAFQSLGTNVFTTVQNVALPISPAAYDLSFAVSPPFPTIFAIAPNLTLPYTVQWSGALERALGDKQTLTLSYVGANGRSLIKENLISGGPLNANFTTVALFENGLTSNYQALQAQFQRRVSPGLQVLIAYTWSHNLDYGSEDANAGYKRGNSDFDVRDSLNAAMTWDLPWNRGNAFSRNLLGNWGLDGRLIARTGFPVTLAGNSFFDPVSGSLQSEGLNLVSGAPLYIYSPLLPGGREINRNAFNSAANGTIGDAPRNFVRGFGEEQINLAVRREFPLFENLKLQFRAEAFNVFNHPNFGRINPTLGSAIFGQATSTLANSLGTVSPLYQQGGARSIQFALKLLF